MTPIERLFMLFKIKLFRQVRLLPIIVVFLAVIFCNTIILNGVSAITTHQYLLVQNTNKNVVMQKLEEFVVKKGYRFEYTNPQTGLFQVFCEETDNGSFDQFGNYNSMKVVWGFSVEINQINNNVEVKASSRGAIAPGKYIKAFYNYLKDSGLTVYNDKDLKTNPGSALTDNSQINEPQMSPFEQRLQNIELKLFNKTNADLTTEERLSLIEIKLFKTQFANMGNEARLRAIENTLTNNVDQ